MTKRIYKVIGTTTALRNLQAEADKAGVKQAVGISPSKAIYIWNKDRNAPEKIGVEQAAEILQTTPEEVVSLLQAKGDYEIQDKVEVKQEEQIDLVEEKLEDKPEYKPEVEPAQEDKDVLKLLELIEEATKRSTEEIVNELRKVDVALAEKIEKLQESVTDLATIVRDHILL